MPDATANLGDLLLLLLRTSGVSGVGLRDLGAMHRALAEPVEHRSCGWVAVTVGSLGHAPDVVYGRRVCGLDAAITDLENERLLHRERDRWLPTSAGRRRAARLVIGLPMDAQVLVANLNTKWERQRTIAAALESEARRSAEQRTTSGAASRAGRSDQPVS